MRLKSLTCVALSAVGALASNERRAVTDSAGFSVLSVLATAIPKESIDYATGNPSAFSAELASSLSAGQTPDWYNALPSDVKIALPKLYPNPTSAVATSAEISSSSSSSSASSTPISTYTYTSPYSSGISSGVSASASISSSLNSTSIIAVSSPTLASTGGANSESPAAVASIGGASYPTVVVGAGLTGALGFLGMLAL